MKDIEPKFDIEGERSFRIARVLKVGGSLVVPVPRNYMRFLNIREKDYVAVEIERDSIQIRRIRIVRDFVGTEA